MAQIAPPYEVFAHPARDQKDRAVMAVWAKRTYEFDLAGNVSHAEEQLPLEREVVEEKEDEQPVSVPIAEPDLFPYKPLTDVVVKGTVHPPRGGPVMECDCGISVGATIKKIRVYGDRVVERRPRGRLGFTPPTPFDSMPLTYHRAYGGIDVSLPTPEPVSFMDMLDFFDPTVHPGAYPRNPAGVGYRIKDEPRTVDGCPLPNFEDPHQLLEPDRFLAVEPEKWWTMPLPQGLGWFDSSWYPRMTALNLWPRVPAPDHLDIVPEVRLGYMPKRETARQLETDVSKWIEDRLGNGASPGLAIKGLAGKEPVTLLHLTPEPIVKFKLPGEQPEIGVRFEKKWLKVKLSLLTVLVEPDEGRFALTWCGLARTPRALPDHAPTPEEPVWDPLRGVDVVVDRVPYVHEEVDAGAAEA
jgi:hypothetical protein